MAGIFLHVLPFYFTFLTMESNLLFIWIIPIIVKVYSIVKTIIIAAHVVSFAYTKYTQWNCYLVYFSKTVKQVGFQESGLFL